MTDELATKIEAFLNMARYVAVTLECRLNPPFSDDMKAISEQAAELLKAIQATR